MLAKLRGGRALKREGSKNSSQASLASITSSQTGTGTAARTTVSVDVCSP